MKMPPHSVAGDSTDYDTEGDEQMKQVLAQMPALLPVPSLAKSPPVASRASQLLPLPPPPPLPLQQPPPPPLMPPTTSGAGAKLLRQTLGRPPASEADESVRSKEQ